MTCRLAATTGPSTLNISSYVCPKGSSGSTCARSGGGRVGEDGIENVAKDIYDDEGHVPAVIQVIVELEVNGNVPTHAKLGKSTRN